MKDKKSKGPKKRTRLSRRFLLFFAILVLVCLFVLVQNQFGGGSLRRIVYMIGSGVSGTADETSISFDSSDTNRFHLFQPGLAVLSSDGLRMYTISGKEKNFTPLVYRNPALTGCKKTVAAFDRGGKQLTVVNGKKTLLTQEAPAPIIGVNMNRSGAFSMITDGPDCKALVTVYSASLKEVYKLYSTEQYVVDAAVSNDGKRMAALCFSAKNGQFEGAVTFYRLDEEAPYATVALPDSMPVRASFGDGGELVVLCEDRLIRFQESGEKKSEILFDGKEVMHCSLESPKFGAVLLNQYSTGGYAELAVSARNETTPARIQFSEDIFYLSAAGNYIAVQFLDRIVVYKSDLTEYHTYEIPTGARSCIMREDGTVLVLGSNWANLLIS